MYYLHVKIIKMFCEKMLVLLSNKIKLNNDEMMKLYSNIFNKAVRNLSLKKYPHYLSRCSSTNFYYHRL